MQSPQIGEHALVVQVVQKQPVHIQRAVADDENGSLVRGGGGKVSVNPTDLVKLSLDRLRKEERKTLLGSRGKGLGL